MRGHLSELGIVAARGLLGLAELAAIVRDKKDQRLPVTARIALMILVRQIEMISTEITTLDTALRKENKASEVGPRLETIPSVGPVIASALRARVTDAALFKNGRHLSAWIGIVPENDSTGGKFKQKGLSKKGDRYLRALLVTGAWPSCARRKLARTSIPGSRSCSAACRPSRRQSRSPTRPRGSPGPSWSTAASMRPAIARRIIAPRRTRPPDKWLGNGVIAATGGARLQRRVRGTRRKASRLRRC